MTHPAPELASLLGKAQLPALPQSAIRLLELAQDPENGPDEFAVPIEADPGLMGQVLRFVNSSYFGFSREIASVKLAITLVGIRTIKNFALWSAVFSLMPNLRCGPFSLPCLWQDSLRRGLFARAVGRAMKLRDAEELFSAALLQDVAIPLLAKQLPEPYEEMLVARTDAACRLSDLETARFGWNHAEAAAVIADVWSFPESFRQLVEHHANVQVWAEPVSREVLVVNLSSLLPSTLDSTWRELPTFLDGFQRLTGGESEVATGLLQEVDDAFADVAPVLQVANPSETLVERLEAQLDEAASP